MSDPFSTLPPEVALEQAQISRQQQLANLLMQQGMQQPQGQMISGRYVPPSIFQNLANLANIYVGQQKLEESDKQRAELAQKLREGESKTVKEYFKALQGTPATYGADIPTETYETVKGQMISPATGPNYQQALQVATNPYAPSWLKAQAVEQLKPQKLSPEETLVQRDPTTGEMRIIGAGAPKYRAPIQIDTLTAIELRDPLDPTRVLQRIPVNRVATEKAPTGYRFTADGSLEPIKGGPADTKSQQKFAGQENVDTLIGGLRDQYNILLANKGITSKEAGTLPNIQSALSRSAVGQAVGQAVGSSNQSARNTIAQSRPLLLNAIKEATGMSAKQMDSNAELKMYLAAATDPNLDYESNIYALNQLENLFGTASANRQTGANVPQAAKPTGMPSQSAIDAEIARRQQRK